MDSALWLGLKCSSGVGWWARGGPCWMPASALVARFGRTHTHISLVAGFGRTHTQTLPSQLATAPRWASPPTAAPAPPAAPPQAIEKRALAKESVQRLQKFMAQIRNNPTVDLSTERLGDEGFSYIIDSLSFNDRQGVWGFKFLKGRRSSHTIDSHSCNDRQGRRLCAGDVRPCRGLSAAKGAIRFRPLILSPWLPRLCRCLAVDFSKVGPQLLILQPLNPWPPASCLQCAGAWLWTSPRWGWAWTASSSSARRCLPIQCWRCAGGGGPWGLGGWEA